MTPSRPRSRQVGRALSLLLTAGLVAGAAPAAALPAAPATAPQRSTWLVSTSPGTLGAVADAARRSGATVVRALPAVDVLVVEATASALAALRTAPGVLGTRADSPVHTLQDATTTVEEPVRSVHRQTVRADRADALGATGEGVVVALVDTGVSAVPALADRLVPVRDLTGQVAPCVDLSPEQDCTDGYGHGTFLAGLIASTDPTHPGTSRADLLSVKVADAAGTSSVLTLLAALDWVLTHRDAYSVDVVNLSLGTPSASSWRVDPLNHAVQRLVAAGVVVVVAAGNTGPDPQSITKPGDDPSVLTVGATDDAGTPRRRDDVAPAFSASGPTRVDALAKPDVTAPGVRLVGLRSPGSAVERAVPGGVDAAHRRGSGTSMATAVVSGVVAQVLSAHPEWSPAQVKAALARTAAPVRGGDPAVVGHGTVDAEAAVRALVEPVPVVLAADGSVPDPSTLDWQSTNWQSTNWQSTNWQSTNWQSTNWQSTNWQSTNWQSTNWQSTNWQSTNWQSSWESWE